MSKYFFLGVLFIFSVVEAAAQRLEVINRHLWDNREMKVSERDYERIVETTKEVMQQYYENASFMDKEKGEVTQQAINNFREAFLSGAKIKDDLAYRTRDGRNFNDYASRVLDYLKKTGVNFEMRSATIGEIYYDEAGYYNVEVKSVKTIYNGLDFNDRPLKCKTGRRFFLKFIIHIEANNLGKGGIAKIAGTLQSGCKDAELLVGLNLRYGQDFIGTSGVGSDLNTIPADIFYPGNDDSGTSDFKVDMSTVSALSIGGSFNLPITKEEAFYLSANVNYSIYNFKTDIKGTYYYKEDVDSLNFEVNTDNFYRYVRVAKASEKVTLHTLEIPIGVLYRKSMKTNDQFFFGAYLLFVPTIHLSQSTSLNVGNEDISYWFTTNANQSNNGLSTFFSEEGNPNFGSLENAFGNGYPAEKISASPKVATKTAFAVRFSPFVQFVVDSNEKILVEVALDYTHGLIDMLENSTNAERFIPDHNQDLNNIEAEIGNRQSTVLQTYFSKSTVSTIGLRLGVIYKL